MKPYRRTLKVLIGKFWRVTQENVELCRDFVGCFDQGLVQHDTAQNVLKALESVGVGKLKSPRR